MAKKVKKTDNRELSAPAKSKQEKIAQAESKKTESRPVISQPKPQPVASRSPQPQSIQPQTKNERPRPQPAVETKYTPVPDHRPAPQSHTPDSKPFVDHYDLPASYNSTYLTLMPRDPYWIHAYWEMGQDSRNHLQHSLGPEMERSTYVLRVYDVSLKDFNGSNANSWFDLDVGARANNWYINSWKDNVSYCAELGMRAPDGRFVPVARSNFVNTPRQNSSGRSDVIWMEEKAGKYRPFVSVPSLNKQTATAKYSTSSKSRKIYLTEDDIRAYYSRLFPLLRLVISARDKLTHEDVDVELLGTYLTGAQAQYLEKYLLGGLSRSQFLKKIILGSSQEMVIPGGASESVKGGASERQEKKRQFFFEIGTELIVYGRTEPDAEVWLGDKKIALRADGTFTLRFALPDGKIPLDFVAISHDKAESRTIKTAVERSKTEYKP